MSNLSLQPVVREYYNAAGQRVSTGMIDPVSGMVTESRRWGPGGNLTSDWWWYGPAGSPKQRLVSSGRSGQFYWRNEDCWRTNRIQNSSFEYGTGVPSGWSSLGGTITQSDDHAAADRMSHSSHIEDESGVFPAGLMRSASIESTMRGRALRLTVWLKWYSGTGAGGGYLRVESLSGGQAVATSTWSLPDELAADWKPYPDAGAVLDHVVAATADSVRVTICTSDGPGRLTVGVDDVRLHDLNE